MQNIQITKTFYLNESLPSWFSIKLTPSINECLQSRFSSIFLLDFIEGRLPKKKLPAKKVNFHFPLLPTLEADRGKMPLIGG